MTVLADTKAAMLDHVPKSEGPLHNGLLLACSWQSIAQAMTKYTPTSHEAMNWWALVWFEWDEARPKIPDQPRGGTR